MRFLLFFFPLAYAAIKNSQAPICQNCIHYRPTPFSPFSPSLSKCSQFGTKNIITSEIRYEYADLMRMSEENCGIEGKYYNESSLLIRAIQYAFIYRLPTTALTVLFFMMIWSKNMD
jgi:hypothetical protein